MSTPDQVLSDFIDAWNTGRRPRVREYLARVADGPERDELAEQLTSWLELAPTPEFSDSTRATIRSEPLVSQLMLEQLRSRAGLSAAELATRLVDRLSLNRADAERARGYLERLEHGALDPARLSHRLLDALGALLGVSGRSLSDSASLTRGLRPAAAIFRSAGSAGESVRHDIQSLSRAALTPAPPPMDELDRLFTGGPDA